MNGGPSSWTTTLQHVRASRGEFTYADHGTPWSVVSRNLDVTVARPTSEYRGQARFTNGTISIQNYVPMRADMSTTFRIVDGKVVLDRIDLTTDGSKSELTGEVDLTRWPEQTYRVVRSQVDFPRMRDIFFADRDFTVGGEGEFTGTFHLFRETVNGRSRTGRELKGVFSSASTNVNRYQFTDLRGALLWVPERFEVTDATAALYGGRRDSATGSGLSASLASARSRASTPYTRTSTCWRSPTCSSSTASAWQAAPRAQPARMAAGPLFRSSRRRRNPTRTASPTLSRFMTASEIDDARAAWAGMGAL